ncbi:voltage-gated potassium channel [Exidia glandulosa HHB12029]|uniref:Voltage-gated potassium channel n=1 Tax=Exidia glandulosa HHB12029 TaxID=1314781 RepID=A0A165MZA7_EXIGL|nr:voltage-gated potassium channel [Exidia glandulosa HHB12029]
MFTRKPVDKSWRHHLHKLLESPNSSPAAFIIHFVTTFLIVFSALVTILETLPIFHSRGDRVWFGIETSLVALFTVEYVARVLAWSTSWSSFLGWFSSFFAIIDLLAILPYYIEIALQADTSAFFRFSILRTFRLLRVFRPFRYSNTLLLTIEVMFLSFKRSKDVLLALSFFLVTTLVIFSTLIYFAERGVWDDALSTFVDSDGEPSQIESIPAAAWFVLVTITTVGYGDVTPRSFLGRIVTVPLLLSGLLLIALPSFVLGREFASIWESVSHNQREGGHDPMLSPIIFSANPDVVNRPRRLHRPSAEASSRQSEDARAAAEQMAVLSKDVQRLQSLVEKQSSDMAHLMAIVRNMASQDKAQ